MERMNSLIAISEKEVGARYEQCVNGRDLHGFLEVGRDFATWIKHRIEIYKFQENQDFIFFPQLGEKYKIGRPRKGRPVGEYWLTIQTAKEFCMIERNEKGRQARKYFIECEKRLKDITTTESQLEAGTFTTGLRTGIILSRALGQNGFDLADAARLAWHRNTGLTQVEAAKLFDVSRENIQRLEQTLKDVGVEFPIINSNKRAKEMRDLLDNMLGFRNKDLRLVKGGAL